MPKVNLFNQPIEVTVLEPKTEKEEQLAKKTIVQKSEGQVVDQAKKDAYLSDQNRVVKEQTSAKNSGTRSAPATASTGEKGVRLSDLGVKISPKSNTNYKEQRNWVKPETGEMLKGGQYIQGMKEGEVSALNTKEFVFFSYYDRVRKQLDQAWQPILRSNIQRIFRSGRKLASHSDYITRTLVTLNKRGEIVKVQLLEESGARDLDSAAVDALNKAGPYPNPPKGLIEAASGEVQIRWDFILKT